MSGSDAKPGDEDLSKLSVAELKRRLSWRNALPAAASEKSELIAALHACPDVGGIFGGDKQKSTPAPVSSQNASGARSFGPGDFAGTDDAEDFSKLSVGELKKRLRWAGASVPPGTTEKSDLVAALKAAPGIHRAYDPVIEQEKPKKPETPKVEEQSTKKLHQPKPVPKLSHEQEENVNFMVLSDEELQRRIKELGGRIPDGEPGKFFLVAMLKNLLKARPVQRSEADLAAEAEMAEMERLLVEAAMEEEQKEAAAATPNRWDKPPEGAAVPPPPPPASASAAGAVQEDVSKLSTPALKRRLAEYGKELLVGLAERSQFIIALQRAIANLPAPAATGVPVDISAEELEAQMAEMERAAQQQAEEPQPDIDMAQAANAGTAAAETATLAAAAAKAKAEAAKRAAATAAGAAAKKRRQDAAKDIAQVVAVVPTPTMPKSAPVKRPKAAPTGNEICLSDGEDEVVCTPGGAAAIALDEDDDAVAQVPPVKQAIAADAAKPKPDAVSAPTAEVAVAPVVAVVATEEGKVEDVALASDADGADGAWL